MAYETGYGIISWIGVSRLTYPLYHYSVYSPRQTDVYFDIGEKIIYDRSVNPPIPFPVAIDPSVIFRVKLARMYYVGAAWRLCAKLRSEYTNLQSMPVFEEIIEGPSVNEPIELCLKPATVNGQPKDSPWRIRGELEWTIEDCGITTYPPLVTRTPVEIYVFPANLPAYLNKAGIPLALLRREEYLPRWMAISTWQNVEPIPIRDFKRKHPRPDDITLTWATFAVYTLFADRYKHQ